MSEQEPRWLWGLSSGSSWVLLSLETQDKDGDRDLLIQKGRDSKISFLRLDINNSEVQPLGITLKIR